MAYTLAQAIAAVEGPELDRIARYTVPPPRAKPTDPRVAIAFNEFDYGDIRSIIWRVADREGVSWADAEEAVHGVFCDLYADRPTLFYREPTSWQGLLYTQARFRVRENRRRNRRLLSSEFSIEPEAGSDASPWAPSIEAVDARGSAAPASGEEWTRTQVIGVFQRFGDRRGRPPKASECKRLYRLPSLGVVSRLFGSFDSALLEAGMLPRATGKRRRKWPPIQAARACRGFYRRHGRWPDSSDADRYPGTLPSASTMKRLFKGTRSVHVQFGAQEILESHGHSTT